MSIEENCVKLQAKISRLNQALIEKSLEVTEYKSKISQLTSENCELTQEREALKWQLKEAQTELVV